MATLVGLTAFLEITCPDEVQKLLNMKGGKALYVQGLYLNAFNVFFLGTLCYVYIVEKICKVNPLTVLEQIEGVFGVIVIEGFLFYVVHKAFHEVKGLYCKCSHTSCLWLWHRNINPVSQMSGALVDVLSPQGPTAFITGSTR